MSSGNGGTVVVVVGSAEALLAAAGRGPHRLATRAAHKAQERAVARHDVILL
ncbi:MAG: hypothetical protein M0005_00175 [Actinomycetota bacterium]|jgi:hypothetical protein|nr:hypothetical protein [Actinomycetota bacterium]